MWSAGHAAKRTPVQTGTAKSNTKCSTWGGGWVDREAGEDNRANGRLCQTEGLKFLGFL